MTYLAKCSGRCSQAVPQQLTWVKFQELSRIQAAPIPGVWGSDILTKAGSTFSMTLPMGLESGEYVSVHAFACSTLRVFLIKILAQQIMRHEILALHDAQNNDPQVCH